jgi:hypothetical protein
MNTKKLTLEDLKLESFLTELDGTKLVKMQGGNGGYGNTDGGDACGNSGECNSCDCDTEDYTNGVACDDPENEPTNTTCAETATDCVCYTDDINC